MIFYHTIIVSLLLNGMIITRPNFGLGVIVTNQTIQIDKPNLRKYSDVLELHRLNTIKE